VDRGGRPGARRDRAAVRVRRSAKTIECHGAILEEAILEEASLEEIRETSHGPFRRYWITL
jgi:hypothetical protein